ncbi:MAG: polysaccharide biosynthesis protein, partial [Dehalococcoidia bacterium]
MKEIENPPADNPQTSEVRPLWHFWRIPLYSNAFYLIAGNGLGAVLGFVFWAVAARFYSPGDVGTMSAAIAALGLLGSLSHLGLGVGIIRFLPGDDKQAARLINFSLSLIFITGALLAVIFLLGTGLWSPGLAPFRQDAGRFIVFTLFTAFTAIVTVADGVFIARRRAGFAMGRGLSMNVLKLIMLITFAATAQAYGIFTSWGSALSISLLLGLFLFLPRLVHGFLPSPNLDWHGRGEMVRYSLVNNGASLLAVLPGQILPIMLLGRLGAEANAFFFIAWQVMGAVSMVPSSISTSLFAEGCHDEEELLHNVRRSLKLAFAILTPVVIALLFFSAPLLRVFGVEYAGHSTRLLQLLSISLIPMSVNQVYFSILRVQKRLRTLNVMNGVIAVVTLGV